MLFHDLDQASQCWLCIQCELLGVGFSGILLLLQGHGKGTYHQVTGSFERIAMLIKLGLGLGADIPPSIDSEDEHEIGLQWIKMMYWEKVQQP